MKSSLSQNRAASRTLTRALTLALCFVALIAVPALAAAGHVEVVEHGAGLAFQPDFSHGSVQLSISGPEGLRIERHELSFDVYDDEGQIFPDGPYVWELRLGAEATPEELAAHRHDEAFAAHLASKVQVATGAFRMVGGSLVAGGLEPDPTRVTTKAQTINTDLIVQGSECVGFDCASSESFGFDTMRIKENNLRVHFDDTSSSANFPKNDWRLVINDSTNGGAEYFAVEDTTAGKVPFRIEAGAIANALYVEDDGDVGIGTANPVVEIHAVDGNSPGFRLEQDGSNGFTPQTWDMVGNESNFFIRDVTNGSALPFRIKPGAQDDSIFIDTDGVGIGTNNPSNDLHVRSNNDTTLLVEGNGGSSTAALTVEGDASAAATVTSAADASLDITGDTASFDVTGTTDALFEVANSNGTATQRQLMTLTNNGGVRFTLKNTSGTNWDVGSEDAGTFVINVPNNGSTQMRMDDAGNATFSGTVTGTSDRNMKRNFEAVDAQAVLGRVADMPMSTWNYKADDASIRHMGPMAQDFYAAFELGQDERHISFGDLGGVALVAIQGLVEEKDAEIRELRDRLAALEALVRDLATE